MFDVAMVDDTSCEEKNKYFCHGWWMSSSSGQNPGFSCQQPCGEILSWMIEIWMRNHLESDSVNL